MRHAAGLIFSARWVLLPPDFMPCLWQLSSPQGPPLGLASPLRSALLDRSQATKNAADAYSRGRLPGRAAFNFLPPCLIAGPSTQRRGSRLAVWIMGMVSGGCQAESAKSTSFHNPKIFTRNYGPLELRPSSRILKKFGLAWLRRLKQREPLQLRTDTADGSREILPA